MQTIWRILFRFGVWFYLAWSKLYRALLEPKGKAPIASYDTLDDLDALLKKTKWVKDSVRQFGDAIGDPEHFQYLLNKEETPESGRDCDEFSTYAYTVLEDHPIEGVDPIGILTVSWWKPWFWKFKKGGGHHVCLILLEDGHAHIGNWGLHRGFGSLEEAIKSVLREYDMIGWFVWNYPDKVLEYGTRVD